MGCGDSPEIGFTYVNILLYVDLVSENPKLAAFLNPKPMKVTVDQWSDNMPLTRASICSESDEKPLRERHVALFIYKWFTFDLSGDLREIPQGQGVFCLRNNKG